MKSFLFPLAAVGCAALMLQGYSSTVGVLGWTETDIRRGIEEPLRRGPGYSPLWLLKSSAKQAIQAMDEAARAQLVRDLFPVVKGIVMSADYASRHEGYIRQTHGAVNHGVEVAGQATTVADAEEQMKDVQRQLAAQMALTIRQMPPEAAKMLFTDDVQSWKQQADDKGSEDRQKFQKLFAQAKQIEPLITSNPAEFVKRYSSLKNAEYGGSGLDSDIAADQGAAQQQREQRAWNEHNLHAVLRHRLTEFVQLADSVDFAAQTSGPRRRFVNPGYERKSDQWKMLYRFGKAPTMAASQAAKQWLGEL